MSLLTTRPHESDSSASTATAVAPSRNGDSPTDDDPAPVKRQRRRPSTSHLKFVPETLELREQIKAAAERYAEPLDKSNPFTRAELEQHGRALLDQLGLPEKYLGFTMVLIGNFFWKRQFLATPFNRRMLLLPHCLKHAEGCPADYDEFGLDCEKCGACSIADYKVRAEQLGYKVLVAEGSPIVLKIIVAGYIDGILGVACLNVLEKAIDKVLIAGVPSYAVPLHTGDCKNTSLDESWIWEVIEQYEPLPAPQTTSYVPLMRSANRLFDERFDTLLPRVRSKPERKGTGSRPMSPDPANPANASVPVPFLSATGDNGNGRQNGRDTAASASPKESPLAQTERIAYDWLINGGKRFRPFITLAAHDALTGGSEKGVRPLPAGDPSSDKRASTGGLTPFSPPAFPDGVSRVAMAIEAFHKASLVHDDIEDDDLYRYGQETLHRRHGLGTAINVGDYLIGLGYRLVNSARSEIGAEAACDIVERMAAAHIKLCDGQGAEMAWQAAGELSLTPLDALQIYALKTAPAFEAALYAGLRMAGPVQEYEEMIPTFSRHLGVGFQILNDLKDWQGDQNNKLVAGQDALSLRPTLLLALALDAATPDQRRELEEIYRPALVPCPSSLVPLDSLRRL
ncbi:MAG TPA: polyprenyl synthetase family protein, partial [Planctomycetaceae bacterium]|nr:polyprenyl synthetase family protein [Planctomycetaceae bacterium]